MSEREGTKREGRGERCLVVDGSKMGKGCENDGKGGVFLDSISSEMTYES